VTGDPVPLVDLKAQHRQVAEAVAQGFARVMEGTSFVLGPAVAEFEEAFARFSSVRFCVGVANGTDAIEIALRAVGIGPGDEVIVPTNTFIASALGVARAGAVPVLVDCEAEHHLIDPDRVAERIGPRTRAILPVHLEGQMAPMSPLHGLAHAHGLVVVEDAAQSQGATQDERGVAATSVAAATSFYPGKNLGAYGDAGAVLTNDEDTARKVRALRNYGSEIKYHHPETGFNSRLDSLQAVVLCAKLAYLAEWNHARRAAARRYDELLADLEPVTRPGARPGNEHVWHLYVVRVPNRDAVLARLQAAGIGAGVHYPTPIHLQGAFRYLGHRVGDFPVAEKAAADVLSLPLFPEITVAQQERVVAALRAAIG
jgi:dTDP-4-amino-4,6-dideoxygalactose transaminase